MYKKQLGFQKIACLLAVVTSAVWFIYSLGMITDIYDALYFTMLDPDDLTSTLEEGSILYYDMQGFNKLLLYAAIALILLSCLLYLTNTNVRRKYYIGNYVAVGLYSVTSLAVMIWSHIEISAFKTQFLTTVDFEALLKWSQSLPSIKYTESTFLLDLHYLVAGLALVSVVLMVINVYWKVKVMGEEKALIAGGKEVAV